MTKRPIVPYAQVEGAPVRFSHISENMEVVARDIRDNLLLRWMRSTTLFRFGQMTNTTPTAQCEFSFIPACDVLLTGLYVGLYAADTVTATITVYVDGDSIFTVDVTGGGATVRVDATRPLANLCDANEIRVRVASTGTWTINECHIGIAMEHDRFQGAPPTAPSPVRLGRSTPALLRTTLNTFNAAADVAIDADAAADEQAHFDVLRGPTGVAHTAVTADAYTLQIPDTGQTIRTATLVLVADSGITVTATIADKDAVTQHTLTAVGTGASNEVVDRDAVGDTQPGNAVATSSNDWTVVFAVTSGTGTIQECYLVLEWE